VSASVDDMTSSSEEDILMNMWLKLCKRRKRKWIHDFNESCAQHGAYVHLPSMFTSFEIACPSLFEWPEHE
jgi:hypothetical protein